MGVGRQKDAASGANSAWIDNTIAEAAGLAKPGKARESFVKVVTFECWETANESVWLH